LFNSAYNIYEMTAAIPNFQPSVYMIFVHHLIQYAHSGMNYYTNNSTINDKFNFIAKMQND
ncbi:hypothetical protein H8356DRAFT_947060, partial [Neocallimastix lanati (nom. inval.)]